MANRRRPTRLKRERGTARIAKRKEKEAGRAETKERRAAPPPPPPAPEPRGGPPAGPRPDRHYRELFWATVGRLVLLYFVPLLLLAVFFHLQYGFLLRDSQRAHLQVVAE